MEEAGQPFVLWKRLWLKKKQHALLDKIDLMPPTEKMIQRQDMVRNPFAYTDVPDFEN